MRTTMLTREQMIGIATRVLAEAEAQRLQAHLNAVGTAAACEAMRNELIRLTTAPDDGCANVQSNNAESDPAPG